MCSVIVLLISPKKNGRFDRHQTLDNTYAFVSVPHDPDGIWPTYWHSAILNSLTHASQHMYCYLSVEINRRRNNRDTE